MRPPVSFSELHWRDLSASAAKLYLVLLILSDNNRRLKLSYADVSLKADLSESTFRLARQKLQHSGLVRIKAGLGRGNESEWFLPQIKGLYYGQIQRSEVMRDVVNGLSGTETKLLGATLILADKTGRFRATISKLQTISGLGKESIRTARKALRQRRLLDFQNQQGGLTLYQLLRPASRVSNVEMSPVVGGGKALADYKLKNKRIRISKDKKESKSKVLTLSPSREGETHASTGETFSTTGDIARDLEPHEIYGFINECSLLVGSVKYNLGRPGPGAKLQKMLKARLRDGYTLKDLKQACQAAANDRNEGSRWRMLSNLFYIWGNGLHSFLTAPAASPVARGGTGRRGPVFRKGKDLEQWRESSTEKKRHSRVEDFIKRMGK